jgi:hypothetical protein
MGYLELSELDRKRYGVPERVEFTNHRFGMRTIKQLRMQTGYDYEVLARLLAGVPKVDPATNEPVYELDESGELVKDEEGNAILALTIDEDAVAAYVWLVLWAAGHRIPWSEFDVEPVGLRIHLADDEEPEVEQGKGEETSSSTTMTDPN